MLLCHCRAFNEEAVKKLIENKEIDHAEKAHDTLAGLPPNCGVCLQRIEAMRLAFAKAGRVPDHSALNNRDLRTAAQLLGKRYHKEHDNKDITPVPDFKKPYIARYLKGRDNSLR